MNILMRLANRIPPAVLWIWGLVAVALPFGIPNIPDPQQAPVAVPANNVRTQPIPPPPAWRIEKEQTGPGRRWPFRVLTDGRRRYPLTTYTTRPEDDGAIRITCSCLDEPRPQMLASDTPLHDALVAFSVVGACNGSWDVPVMSRARCGLSVQAFGQYGDHDAQIFVGVVRGQSDDAVRVTIYDGPLKCESEFDGKVSATGVGVEGVETSPTHDGGPCDTNGRRVALRFRAQKEISSDQMGLEIAGPDAAPLYKGVLKREPPLS